MDLPINEDLVSGLLTALNQFTIMEFKQGIESIDMGGLRWVYLLDKDSGLLYIAAGTKEDSAEILRARLNVIKQEFTRTYVEGDGTSWRKEWDGNVEKFYPFKKIMYNTGIFVSFLISKSGLLIIFTHPLFLSFFRLSSYF